MSESQTHFLSRLGPGDIPLPLCNNKKTIQTHINFTKYWYPRFIENNSNLNLESKKLANFFKSTTIMGNDYYDYRFHHQYYHYYYYYYYYYYHFAKENLPGWRTVNKNTFKPGLVFTLQGHFVFSSNKGPWCWLKIF